MTDILSPRPGALPEGLVPPQSIDAESAVLGALLLDFEAVGRAVETLNGNEFYRDAHRKIFLAIVGLFNKGERADLITVTEELRRRGDLEAVGGSAYLSRLLDYGTASTNLDHHCRIVYEKSVLRELIRVAEQVKQECFSASDETNDILDRAEQRVFAVADTRVRAGFISLRELLKPTFDHIQKLFDRKVHVTGVPSGYDDLDALTAGFQPGDLIVIGGRPSIGKTSFALNIAENAAIRHQVPVAIFSLEMSAQQLALRLLCSQSGVSLQKVRTGHLADRDWPDLTTGAGLLSQAPIVIDDSASVSVLEVRAKARRLKAENRLGLVIIDYLQLMRPVGQAENRVQEIGQMTRGLKALAKELDVPVIVLSQLSRAVETRHAGGRPQLSDLRESGCLTADTRVVRADTGAETSLGELLLRGERNVPVWTLDESWRLVQGTMTHVFASGVKPVYELRLASGRRVKASANHPFLTLEGWRPLEALAVGSRLAVPRRLPEPECAQPWPESEVVMLAHLLGDGCFASNQPIHYTSADPANLAAAERAAAHFGITLRRVPQRTWCHVYLPAPFPLTHRRHNPIASWLRRFKLYGLRSYEKFIPREVFGLPRAQLALFIRHLWATDGCLARGWGEPACIHYSSTSRRLVEDLNALLLRFGILTRVRCVTKRGYRPGYMLHLYGTENQLRFLEEIGVHGARGKIAKPLVEALSARTSNPNVDTVPREVWGSVKRSMAKRGVTARALAAGLGTAYCGSTVYKHAPSRERLGRVSTLLEDRELHHLSESDVFWDTVAAIESMGEEPVYDATVPGTHNFIANGLIAHNSVEQDSDLVMFVYREVIYKPDTQEPGKALIIVAKQRNGPTADVALTFLREQTKFVPYTPIHVDEEPGYTGGPF